MWRAHLDHSNFHITDTSLLKKLMHKWTSIKAAVQDPFQTISSEPSFSSVCCPTEAYIRVFDSLSWVEKELGAWQDFVEVFWNFQQSLLELQAFLNWWEDICTGENFRPPICVPTQGTIKMCTCTKIMCTGL